MSQTINFDNAVELNIKVRSGNTFLMRMEVGLNGDPLDMTGYTGLLQVKNAAQDETSILEFSSPNDIIFGNGEFTITKSNVEMRLPAGEYIYDFEVTDTSSITKTWLFGTFTIIQDVSRG